MSFCTITSKLSITYLPKQQLKKNLIEFLSSHHSISSKALKRPVFLKELPDAILKRKDSKMRLESFFSGIEILKHAKKFSQVELKGKKCFEIEGFAKGGESVKIHIREEVTQKDKKLFLISTFYKKTSPS